jgi:hypothetical protein
MALVTLRREEGRDREWRKEGEGREKYQKIIIPVHVVRVNIGDGSGD